MTKPVTMGVIAAPAALVAGKHENPGVFDAVRVAHSGTLEVDAPPEKAFQLFTAPGERLWVEDWDPVVPSGGDGRESGAVFLTSHGAEVTIWVVIDHDDDNLHAQYARVTPGSRAGTVEVQVRADGEGNSVVDVRYDLTALSEAGNDVLAQFNARQYSQMLKEWEDAIRSADIDFTVLE